MPYTETTHSLFNELQRHMLENTIDNGVTWQLHTAAEVHSYLNHRLARFLLETQLLVTRSTIIINV